MIQARTFSTLLALGALTALPGCSYLGMNGGGSGQQYSQATPSTQASSPAASQETAEADNANYAPQSQVRQPITTALVRKVQSQLKRNGLYHGNIDGIWGPRSEQAATQFQQNHNLNTTGQINLPMLQAMNLNLSNANQQYGQANTGANAMGSNGQGGLNHATPNQQYGQANTGQNGSMAPNGSMNGNTGPNANTQQYGQANTGQNGNMAPNGNAAPNGTMNGSTGPNGNTQQYGQANAGQAGSMSPNANTGANAAAGTNQYGQANTGPNANSPNNMQSGANTNYTTGNQNTGGTAQASNGTTYNNGPNTNHDMTNKPAPGTSTGTTR